MKQETPQIRVALVDDHAMVRQSLSSVLEDEPGILIVAQGSNRQEAMEIAKTLRPDVLVLDYNMPGGGALEVLENIGRLGIDVRVLILTLHESVHYAVRSLEAGAQGFMIKSCAVEELVNAIRSVHRGQLYIPSSVSPRVIEQLRLPKRDRIGLASLSVREFEMLRAIGSGMSLKEAARHLKVGVSTASTYRARVLKKLGLTTTSEMIRFALESDVIR